MGHFFVGHLFDLQQAITSIDNQTALINAFKGEKWNFANLPMPTSDEELRQKAMEEKERKMYQEARERGEEPQNLSYDERINMEITEEEKQAEKDKIIARMRDIKYDHGFVSDRIIMYAKQSLSIIYEQTKLPDDFKPGDPEPPLFDSERIEPSRRIMVPAYRRAFTQALRTEASLRAAQTALAIERYVRHHNRLPDTLEEVIPYCVTKNAVIDPFNNEYLGYQVNEDNYRVFSVADKMTNEYSRLKKPGMPSAITFTVYR